MIIESERNTYRSTASQKESSMNTSHINGKNAEPRPSTIPSGLPQPFYS